SSGRIEFELPLFNTDPLRRRIMYMLNMNTIVEHLCNFLEFQMTTSLVPFFNPNSKTRSTGDMPMWFTTKHCEPFNKSHINLCVYDSAMEATEANKINKNPNVYAFAKNDHLGFAVQYIFNGISHSYYPDYLIKLNNGKTLVLETKGQNSEEVKEKRRSLEKWILTVNSLKEYGEWYSDISFNIADVDGIISKYC
ncbi:MAG: hypothetical protein LBI14_06105, partial [Treponema sp.]|nr:hypothetical protein [Treponema sp.]